MIVLGGIKVSRDFERTRYGQRSKKRKTNIILNSLIGIVLLLIIFVSATIFLGNDEEDTSKEQKTEQEETAAPENKEEAEEDTEKVDETKTTDPSDSQEQTQSTEPTEETAATEEPGMDEDAETVVTEGGGEPNVVRTIVNPAWKPVGTVQTGEHVNVYSGVDWDEMVDAISYATNLSKDAFTIKFLGNNGPNKSVGTIYTKGKKELYRVYIEWVDGEGWKPTKVEELSSL